MRDDFEKFRQRKASVTVIVPHDAPRVKKFWEEERLPFTGIPDPEGKLGRLYGQQWKTLKLGRMPAVFIVDTEGRIALARYGENMADIPRNEELLALIEKLELQIVKGRN